MKGSQQQKLFQEKEKLKNHKRNNKNKKRYKRSSSSISSIDLKLRKRTKLKKEVFFSSIFSSEIPCFCSTLNATTFVKLQKKRKVVVVENMDGAYGGETIEEILNEIMTASFSMSRHTNVYWKWRFSKQTVASTLAWIKLVNFAFELELMYNSSYKVSKESNSLSRFGPSKIMFTRDKSIAETEQT